jgi:TolB-like protein
LVFSNETKHRIAVFPFEDMDGIFVRNEAKMFYQEFTNEFKNRMPDRTVVPREDVERLIGIEADFQLKVFSAKAKTAEMQSVLNGTRILYGRIGKLGDNIRIAVSLYTYPELEQLPGGASMNVANKEELFSKIPELVKKIQAGMSPPPISAKTKRPPRPKWSPRGTIFEDYTIYNALAIFGYTYAPDMPLGFSLGFVGVYTSLGFAVPSWGDYKKVTSSGSNVSSYYSIYPPDYSSSPILDQRYQIIDWVIGYNVTIIPKILYLPLGVGIEATRGWRLQRLLDRDGKDQPRWTDPEWNPAPQWENNVLFEAGLLFRPTNKIEFEPYWFGEYRFLTFSPYIFGSYRYIMPEKHSFSIGGGISFEKQ